MRDSKHQDIVNEEDEDEDEDEAQPAAQAAAASGSVAEEEKKDDVDGLVAGMADLTVSEPGHFSYDMLVKGLKENKYRKVLIMTGAGISVSAGIPDFRSPDTGLYANLAEYNLPRPEAIFDISYFKEKPEPFYKFAQHFDLS